MWGRPHEDDLSRCENYEDYIEKLNYVIKKLYFSLRQNGYLAILVGDIRQKGVFHSIAADMLHIGNIIADDTGTVKWTCNVKAAISGIKRAPESQKE